MSDREKAINILKELPDTISMKEILDTLYNVFDLKDRLDNLNENEGISSEEFKKEIEHMGKTCQIRFKKLYQIF